MSDLEPRSSGASALPLRRYAKLRSVETAASPAPSITADSPAVHITAGARSSGHAWAQRYRTKLLVTEIGISVMAVTPAFLARFGIDGASTSIGSLRAGYWAVPVLIVATWLGTLGVFRTHDSRVVHLCATEYKPVVNANALAFGLLAVGFLIVQVEIVRGFFILALPLGVAGLTLGRWLWRTWLLHQRLCGHYLARVIVVGNRDDIEYVVREIDEKSGAAYYVVGADAEGADTSITAGGPTVPVVAGFDGVAMAAATLDVDIVIVAGQPSGGSQYIRSLGWELEGTSAELVLSSRLKDVAGPRIHSRPVEGLPLIHVEIPRFEGAKYVFKRTLDVVAAGIALILLSPALVVIAGSIRFDSPGPVLFRQERCGLKGRSFRIVKFRAMVRTAKDGPVGLLDRNEASGVLFTIRNDPRITPVGRVLRKYSADELRQLWNILISDMSIVGRRPLLPEEVECYETHVRRRLYIELGLTGMRQVNGPSNVSWEDSVRLDLYYVENWSLTGDLMIIWRTCTTIIRPEGAY